MTPRDYVRHYVYLYVVGQCKPTDRVLELGCGSDTGPAHLGPWLISRSVKDYTAVDIKPWRNPRFNYVQADIETYEPEGMFDKIICLQTIAYVDPDRLAEKIKRHLSGTAYLSESQRWRDGVEKSTPEEIAHGFRDVLKMFKSVDLLGIDNGIIVPETQATSGILAIAQN